MLLCNAYRYHGRACDSWMHVVLPNELSNLLAQATSQDGVQRHATQVSLLHEGTSMQSPTPKSGDSIIRKDKGKKVLAQDILSTKTSPPPHSTPTTSTTQPHQPPPHQ